MYISLKYMYIIYQLVIQWAFIFEADANNLFSSLQCKNYVVNMSLYLYVR